MSYYIAYSVVFYLNVIITSVGKERAVFPSIDYSYFCCVFSKEFLFLWVFGKGCVILLWHSLAFYITVLHIMITNPCNEHPLTPHFYVYIVKMGFTGVYIFYFCSKT